MGTEALGNIVLLAFKRVIAVHIQFHYKPNPMLVNLVGIYRLWEVKSFPKVQYIGLCLGQIRALRLLYSRRTPPLRNGMNSINFSIWGSRTGGTCDFYRMGHDSSFGGTIGL